MPAFFTVKPPADLLFWEIYAIIHGKINSFCQTEGL